MHYANPNQKRPELQNPGERAKSHVVNERFDVSLHHIRRGLEGMISPSSTCLFFFVIRPVAYNVSHTVCMKTGLIRQ